VFGVKKTLAAFENFVMAGQRGNRRHELFDFRQLFTRLR